MPENDDLRAIYLNCSLKPDAAASHTMRLVRRSAGIMREEGVDVEIIHVRDHHIPFGMGMDLTESGEDRDDWTGIQEKIEAADILVIASPIWLGVKSSIATLVVERLYGYSAETQENGQPIYYGKTGGAILTGNEDGVKASSSEILYALQHIGFTIPPQADCGWLGEIGPGPSYGDEIDGSSTPAGYDSEFTNKNTTIMTWNLMHLARMLRYNRGIPTKGNTPAGWKSTTNATMIDPDPVD